MEEFHDIRETWTIHELTPLEMRKQWPSDPLLPAVPGQDHARTSGIDVLCVLHRFLLSLFSEQEWHIVRGIKDEGNPVVAYFFADFSAPRYLPADATLVRARDAALRAAQAGLDDSVPEDERYSFAALIRSSAVRSMFLDTSHFHLYEYEYSKLGSPSFRWTEVHDTRSDAEKSLVGVLEWDPAQHPSIQSLADSIEATKDVSRLGRERYVCRDPTFIQVVVKAAAGSGVTLSNSLRFTVSGMLRTDTEYLLCAAVRTRDAALGISSDSVRLWRDGIEVIPRIAEESDPRQTWGFKVTDELPAGQTFILFYMRLPELEAYYKITDGKAYLGRETHAREYFEYLKKQRAIQVAEGTTRDMVICDYYRGGPVLVSKEAQLEDFDGFERFKKPRPEPEVYNLSQGQVVAEASEIPALASHDGNSGAVNPLGMGFGMGFADATMTPGSSQTTAPSGSRLVGDSTGTRAVEHEQEEEEERRRQRGELPPVRPPPPPPQMGWGSEPYGGQRGEPSRWPNNIRNRGDPRQEYFSGFGPTDRPSRRRRR